MVFPSSHLFAERDEKPRVLTPNPALLLWGPVTLATSPTSRGQGSRGPWDRQLRSSALRREGWWWRVGFTARATPRGWAGSPGWMRREHSRGWAAQPTNGGKAVILVLLYYYGAAQAVMRNTCGKRLGLIRAENLCRFAEDQRQAFPLTLALGGGSASWSDPPVWAPRVTHGPESTQNASSPPSPFISSPAC